MNDIQVYITISEEEYDFLKKLQLCVNDRTGILNHITNQYEERRDIISD